MVKTKLKQTTLLAFKPGPKATRRVDDASDQESERKMKLTQKRRDEDSESLQPTSPVKKRKTRVVDSDEEEENFKPRLRGKGKKTIDLTVDDLDESTSPPKRRKLRKGLKSPSPSGSEDDLDENLVLENRLRTRGKQSAFEKGLERLRRKKQGQPAQHSESGSSESGSESEENASRPFHGARPDTDDDDNHASLFGSEHSDDDWIVEDDGNAAALLPTQFTMDAHQDLSHHFRIVFQFLVHVATRPGSERHAFMRHQMKNEEYFSVPLTVARRKLTGLRDSVVASSVWRPDFKKSLETFPELSITPLTFAVSGCDACHLGGRMSTLCGRLLGTPYEREGFGDISSDEESEESDDNDDRRRQRRKHTIEYHLGRFCARRTRVYHGLTHWEFTLFQVIHQEIQELQAAEKNSNSFVKVSYAGAKAPPGDLEDPDSIHEWLESRGVIDIEWTKVKELMESAQNLDIASKKGEED